MEQNLILNKLRDKYNEEMNDINNTEDLLREYSPWADKKIEKLSEDFIIALENGKEFSWLKVDEKLYESLKKSKGKDLSIDYGIPSHIRGDIDNGTLFLCLVNPNINIRVAMSEALKAKKSKNYKYISDYIINTDSKGGIFYMELENLLNNKGEDPGYYLCEYFNPILSAYCKHKGLKSDFNSVDKLCKIFKNKKLREQYQQEIQDIKEMSGKIVNLESFPFRSSTPAFATKEEDSKSRFANKLVSSNSNVSLLSARVIIWKIVDYISSNNKTKPVFIFRRFDRAWKPSIEQALKIDLEYGEEEINDIINELHNEFFLTIGYKNNDNVSKMSKKLRKNNELIEKDFDSIIGESLA